MRLYAVTGGNIHRLKWAVPRGVGVEAKEMTDPERRVAYREFTLRATSYKLVDGGWVPQVQVWGPRGRGGQGDVVDVIDLFDVAQPVGRDQSGREQS